MTVNKVEYYGKVLLDLTEDTVTPETLALGVTAHDASGQVITGTMEKDAGNPPWAAPALNADKKITEYGYYYVYAVNITSPWNGIFFPPFYYGNTNGAILVVNTIDNSGKIARLHCSSGTLSLSLGTQTANTSGQITTTLADVTSSYNFYTAKIAGVS